MSLREVLLMTKTKVMPVRNNNIFPINMTKFLISLILQLAQLCEQKDLKLSKKIHCFDLRSNEWHIAFLQIYETLFKQETQIRNEKGDIKFDWHGNVEQQNFNTTFCSALRPLLDYISEYRKRVAAPSGTTVHKKYTKYADLTFIKTKLE